MAGLLRCFTSDKETREQNRRRQKGGSLAAVAASAAAATAGTPLIAAVPETRKPPSKNCHRLVMLGSSRVGKSSIVSRFLSNKFDENYTPTIEDFHRKIYRIRGETHQLDILDTSGNHPFPAMRRLSFLTGDLFVLVYSIDNRDSFEEVCRLREQILETKMGATSSKNVRKPPKVPMVIVGNKCDKETDRAVSSEEALAFISDVGNCAFVETSARRNVRVEDIFCELFLLGNLPLEMSPSLHKKVQPGLIGLIQAPGRWGLSLRRRLSDAYGSIAPNVRRPSIRTDLLILQSKTAGSRAGSKNDVRRQNRCCVL